mgnify:CR=1 FL=1|jgi:hypothetical protein
MNKWYRLGQAFAKKYSDGELYKFLNENNYINRTGAEGKDFKDDFYDEMCAIVGVEKETETKQYIQGERKYCFYWGFDNKGDK